MTFLGVLKNTNIPHFIEQVKAATADQVSAVLQKEHLSFNDYLCLLSSAAADRLEDLALRSQLLTKKFFGPTILLYAPLYLSNECDNACIYCGFSQHLQERRITLSVTEAIAEAEVLYRQGFRHLLLVSGEKKEKITIPYLQEIIASLHQKFASISLEIFPLTEQEYVELFKAGADGLTIYQETYNQTIYHLVHPSGPKSNYSFRLLTPERAARAGFYRLNIGALLGLGQWQEEALALALHAAYLKKTYWQAQIVISFPRLQASAAKFKPTQPVSDRQLVQLICALRLFQPSVGLVLSTREKQALRDNLIGLGITQMSAGSKTSPGGYTKSKSAEEQFAVMDNRELSTVAQAIVCRGYDPVYKDWDRHYILGGGE